MDENIEDVAKQRVQARMGFIIHLVMYLVVNTGLFVLWRLSGAHYPWFLWPAIGWGIGLVAHAIGLGIGPGSNAERRAIEREVRKLRASAH